MRTLEQLARDTNHLTAMGQKRAINAHFRKHDESRKWPILGKFNATERAIRSIQKCGISVWGYDYCICLDQAISRLVNTNF